MKQNKLYPLRVILFALILPILLGIFSCNNGQSELTEFSDPSTKKPNLDIEEEYMTKEEVIELFYNNFDTFDKIAEFALRTTEGIYCDNNSDKLLLRIGGNAVDIDNLEIGKQIKEIVFDYGFAGIYEDHTGTRIDFDLPSGSGWQGLIYANEGLVESSFYTPLEKENWYYFFVIHSPPGGREQRTTSSPPNSINEAETQQSDTQSQDRGWDYLTKEDVIEIFYENYGTFEELSNYVLEMPGTFYCDRNDVGGVQNWQMAVLCRLARAWLKVGCYLAS